MTYIIIGAILATIGLSLIAGISEVLSLIFEVWKAKLALKIAKINALITKQTEDDSPPTRVVGFTIPNEKEEDDEEYE